MAISVGLARAGEDAHEQIVNDLGDADACRSPAGLTVALLGRQLLFQKRRADQRERLAKRRLADPFAFARGGPRGAAEHVEERVRHRFVGQVDRPRPRGELAGAARELGRDPEDLAERVQQHLGREASRVIPGEGLVVVAVGAFGVRAQGIGFGVAADADQVLDVVAAGGEVARQGFEQLGMARRVRAPGVVDRVDQSAAEEMAPHPVGHRAGEVGVGRVGHPARQARARVVVAAHREVGPAQRTGRHRPLRPRVLDPALGRDVDRLVGRHLGVGEAPLAADAGEDGRQADSSRPGSSARPGGGDTGALDADAEERLRDRLDVILRRPHRAIPDRRRVDFLAADGGEDLGGEPVVGHVRADRIANPGGEQSGAGPLLTGGVAAAAVLQDVGPLQAEQTGVLGTFEQPVDQAGALVRAGVGQVGADFVGRGQRAADVQARAAEEGRVVGRRRGLDSQPPPLSTQQPVDPRPAVVLVSRARRQIPSM